MKHLVGEPCKHRPVGGLEHLLMDLAWEDCHLVAEHDDFYGEVRVVAAGEPRQLEDAAERPIQEREGSPLDARRIRRAWSKSSTQASDGIVGTHKSRQPQLTRPI